MRGPGAWPAWLAWLALQAAAAGAAGARASHWVVTENGLVQPQTDSPFELARPYDLLAFLNQESFRDDIVQGYHDLVAKKKAINDRWALLEEVTNIGSLLRNDENCAAAGPLEKIDLYPSLTNVIRREGITDLDINLIENLPIQMPEVPDCQKYSSLPFSMFTYEHFDAMLQRHNLSIEPDVSLSELVFPGLTLESFGHQMASNLEKNNTSWLHYNLASIYWKVKGNAPKAMECNRRAVYYAPRRFKDIALVGMGTLFHRCKKSHEAGILFHAAVDHGPMYAVNHFALGNAMAVLGDFNTSAAIFSNCIMLSPMFKPAYQLKHGMLCHKKLLMKMALVQTTLQRIRAAVTEYSEIESNWWKQQALFLSSMKGPEHQLRDLTNIDSICGAMNTMFGLDFCHMKKEGDKNSLISIFLENPVLSEKLYDDTGLNSLDTVLTLQRFVKNIDKEKRVLFDYVFNVYDQLKSETESDFSHLPISLNDNEHISDHSDSQTRTKPAKAPDVGTDKLKDIPKKSADKKSQDLFAEYESGPILYPATLKVDRHREAFDTEKEWPPQELCDEWSPKFPAHLDTVYPVFLPFENKGLILKSLLSEKIGLSLSEEHTLPWHPPTCPEVKGTSSWPLPKSAKSQNERVPIEHLRRMYVNYVSDGELESVDNLQEAEIGHRIYTAINKKVAPKWILYTLSALYWRVRRKNANALTCLSAANKMVPGKYRDVVQISLASVLFEVGYVDEALVVAEQAFKLSPYEPATNFLLSLIHMSKSNKMAQAYHMRQVVRVAPEFMDGLARTLLYGWFCNGIKLDDTMVEEGVCLEASNGRRASCLSEGADCHQASLQKIKRHGYKLEEEISTLVKLLDMKAKVRSEIESLENDEGDLQSMDEVILDTRPEVLKERYQLLEKMLNNCGNQDCSALYPVKAQEVQGHNCFFQHLKFWYWLPYLRIETLLSDRNIRIQSKLKLEHMTPYKFPDCRPPRSDGNLVLEWMSGVDAEGWKPVTDLISEVNNLLGEPESLQDVSGLLAYHVDNNPSWLGMVVAGLWCGGFSRGTCAMRCFSAAYDAAPSHYRDIPLLSLISVLHLQDRAKDAKYAAYLALPYAPKSKLHLFIVGISHTYLGEYELAIRKFRSSLSQDPQFAVARACLQATMCLVLFQEDLAKLNN